MSGGFIVIYRLISTLSLAILVGCLTLQAFAEDSKNTANRVANSTNKVTQTHFGLKELARTSQLLQRSAMDLIDEVEQTQVVYGTGPQMLGAIIRPVADFPDEKREEMAGLVPPSKKWVKYIVKQMADLMPMLENDINGMNLPENASSEITGDMHDIQDSLAQIKSHFDNLNTVIKEDKLDNLKIGREALAIYDSLTKINGLTKRMSHILIDTSS